MPARSARFLENNSFYHITVRGRHRLFECSKDYRFYLHILKKHKGHFQIKIYGFCLTSESMQIILQCETAQHLSTYMQFINEVYAFYFNGKYKRKGKLYQERFKGILLKGEQEVRAALREMELWPVHLQLSDSPADYPWSSYDLRMAGHYDGILDPLFPGFSIDDSCFDSPPK